MAKTKKIPGDVLKIMNTVNKQMVDVTIVTSSNIDEPIKFKTPRSLYNNIMKSQLIYFDNTNQEEGEEVISGFYYNEPKTTKCVLIQEVQSLHPSDVSVKVNGFTFKIQKPKKGYTYA